jgi:hypothetical protein
VPDVPPRRVPVAARGPRAPQRLERTLLRESRHLVALLRASRAHQSLVGAFQTMPQRREFSMAEFKRHQAETLSAVFGLTPTSATLYMQSVERALADALQQQKSKK